MLASSRRELVKRVYEVSQEGALSKDWDARSQFRRASVSVMNVIAEGLLDIIKMNLNDSWIMPKLGCRSGKSMLYLFEDLQYLDKEQ
ncbi:MAG: four helix bundle protein [Saprospiraceae bacterium]|nr:four helix bundle protein [Saprospiraceae bacterium]